MKKNLDIYLYDAFGVPALDMAALAEYICETVPSACVCHRNEFFRHHIQDQQERVDSVAARMASIRIRDVDQPFVQSDPLPMEIDYEKRFLTGDRPKPIGIMYDGHQLLHMIWELLPEDERGRDRLHLIMTNQLIGTFDEDDRRYHARVILLGIPHIISTTGVVEGPARPKEFYLLKQQLTAFGSQADLDSLKARFRGTLIDYDDKRLTEVVKGYVMQSIFYHKTGRSFCMDPDCRLFNAHWQADMIRAQLDSPCEFCSDHTEEIRRF